VVTATGFTSHTGPHAGPQRRGHPREPHHPAAHGTRRTRTPACSATHIVTPEPHTSAHLT
ncbi:MAG: hypothetical protein LBI49_04890, partial [Nocardiopsaceae bacterium]|nr:hypothetical protein [Nocardiopsaceae bacterium]